MLHADRNQMDQATIAIGSQRAKVVLSSVTQNRLAQMQRRVQ